MSPDDLCACIELHIYILMRDEKEERKKQARSNKQTRQSNTALYTYIALILIAPVCMKLMIIVVSWLSCYGNAIVIILVLGPYSILDGIQLYVLGSASICVNIYCVCCVCVSLLVLWSMLLMRT